MAGSDVLVWLDMEMSGLDPERERIIEIATILTDGQLTEIAVGPELVIRQPDEVLAAMEPRLVAMLLAAAARFHCDVVDVVSGFRHPKYNLILRKKGHQVARDSQHTHGNAVDFRLPGISVRALESWARHLRLGGVGLYLRSDFVHVDTGVIRHWNGT